MTRRVVPDRRARDGSLEAVERRIAAERRVVSRRRRYPDRRIGLSPDLDLFLLGF